MIYTVTLNPAIDLHIDMPKIIFGQVNKAKGEIFKVGGKGLACSRILKELNVDNVALGFIGGFTGTFLWKKLKDWKLNHDFIEIESPTRINVELNHDNKETNLSLPSFPINEKEYQKLFKQLEKLKQGDILVIAGSLPKDLPMKEIKVLLDSLKAKGVEFVFDLPNDLLLNACRYRPIIIKPNKKELEDLTKTKITNNDQLIEQAKKLLQLGPQNVIVSLDKDGAILVNNKEVIKVKTVKGNVVSTLGAGDSLVGGFLAEYIKSKDLKLALIQGVICGTATAFSDRDVAEASKIEEVRAQFIKEKILN